MFSFFSAFATQKHLIWNLVKSDFRSRYLGSTLGVLWAFIMPLANLGIMWFAFEFGFKSSPKQGIPFILWLVTGMFPWTFFSDSVQSAANSIIEKSFLVKKVVFKVELLPLIKIFAAGIPFIFLTFIMLTLFVVYGFTPDIHWIQIIYYIACTVFLVLCISSLTSAVVVFYRDLGQFISMGLQFGFWGTPIFWSPEQLPEKLKIINFLNPVSYIVTGFRDSLVDKIWFWDKPSQSLYFWVLTILVGLFGQYLFSRLRPHFADVL